MASDEDTQKLDMHRLHESINEPTPLEEAQKKLRDMANDMTSDESRRAFRERTERLDRQITLNGLGPSQA